MDKEPCPETLFTFERVQTEDPAQEAYRSVAIDSMYKLKSAHLRSNGYLLTLPAALSEQLIHSPRKQATMQQDEEKDVQSDVLFATVAPEQFVREKQFLVASLPIFIELLISLEELNKEIAKQLANSDEAQEEASPINYSRFDQVVPKVQQMLKSMTEYLENISLSHIE